MDTIPDMEELRNALNFYLNRKGHGANKDVASKAHISRDTVSAFKQGKGAADRTLISIAAVLKQEGFWPPPKGLTPGKTNIPMIFRDPVKEDRATYEPRPAGAHYVAETQCPECGEWVPGLKQKSFYCIVCGGDLAKECPQCGWANDLVNSLCAKCGTKL